METKCKTCGVDLPPHTGRGKSYHYCEEHRRARDRAMRPDGADEDDDELQRLTSIISGLMDQLEAPEGLSAGDVSKISAAIARLDTARARRADMLRRARKEAPRAAVVPMKLEVVAPTPETERPAAGGFEVGLSESEMVRLAGRKG